MRIKSGDMTPSFPAQNIADSGARDAIPFGQFPGGDPVSVPYGTNVSLGQFCGTVAQLPYDLRRQFPGFTADYFANSALVNAIYFGQLPLRNSTYRGLSYGYDISLGERRVIVGLTTRSVAIADHVGRVLCFGSPCKISKPIIRFDIIQMTRNSTLKRRWPHKGLKNKDGNLTQASATFVGAATHVHDAISMTKRGLKDAALVTPAPRLAGLKHLAGKPVGYDPVYRTDAA